MGVDMDEVRPEEQRAQRPSVLPPGMRIGDRWLHFLREVIETVLIVALVFLVVHVTVQMFFVKGPSMEPGLQNGSYVLVNQLAYRFGTPKRGDVIVFHPPDAPDSEPYIKRIIGLPGDIVTVTTTSIIVDDVTLNEPYIYPLGPNELENTNVLDHQKIDANTYFVLGDHRTNSTDSRVFGGVPRQNIIGKAEFVLFPLSSLEKIPTYSEVFATIKT
jgi:signal peptidase I